MQTLDWRLATAVVRIPDHALLTVTFVGPSGVLAHGSRRTGFVRTIVDQLTATSRFSSVPWLAGTNLHVPLRGADSINTARIVRQAGDSTLVSVADLLLAALVVVLALDRLTADLVVLRVPEEPALAGAHCTVVVSSAFGVASAENQVASFVTLRLANVVLDAPLVVRAIVVESAAQFLDANAVVAVLELGAAGVALAGRLAETVDAELVAYAVPCAATECCNILKIVSSVI